MDIAGDSSPATPLDVWCSDDSGGVFSTSTSEDSLLSPTMCDIELPVDSSVLDTGRDLLDVMDPNLVLEKSEAMEVSEEVTLHHSPAELIIPPFLAEEIIPHSPAELIIPHSLAERIISHSPEEKVGPKKRIRKRKAKPSGKKEPLYEKDPHDPQLSKEERRSIRKSISCHNQRVKKQKEMQEKIASIELERDLYRNRYNELVSFLEKQPASSEILKIFLSKNDSLNV